MFGLACPSVSSQLSAPATLDLSLLPSAMPSLFVATVDGKEVGLQLAAPP